LVVRFLGTLFPSGSPLQGQGGVFFYGVDLFFFVRFVWGVLRFCRKMITYELPVQVDAFSLLNGDTTESNECIVPVEVSFPPLPDWRFPPSPYTMDYELEFVFFPSLP